MNASRSASTASWALAAAACALVACGSGGGFKSGPTYSVGGTVSGLQGSGLTLQVSFPETHGFYSCPIARAANGLHVSLCLAGPTGEQYSYVVLVQPSYPSQTCVVANAVGAIGNANIADVDVTCTTDASRFAYAASTGSNSIAGYSIDAATGALAPLSQSPFAAPSPRFVTVDPTGQHALVGDGSPSGVSVDAVGASGGALTPSTGSPFASGNGPNAAAIDLADSYAYVVNQTDGTVSAYLYVPSLGDLTPVAGSPFPAGQAPTSIAMTIDRSLYAMGQFVYVANSGSNSVSGYIADSSKGSLTPINGSPFVTGNAPAFVAVDPSSQFVYVANQTDGTVSAFKIDLTATNTGGLTAVTGSPFTAGHGCVAIALDAYDRFAYVANQTDGTVSGYAISTTTGALTPVAGSPFATGAGPTALTVDNLGKFLYVANRGSGTVSAYAIDQATGALTPVAGSPFATAAAPISISTGI